MGKFKKFNIFAWVLTVLSVIGNLAWGIFGIMRSIGGLGGEDFLLVDFIFRLEWLSNIIYIIVGLVGLSLIPVVIAMVWKSKRR